MNNDVVHDRDRPDKTLKERTKMVLKKLPYWFSILIKNLPECPLELFSNSDNC